MNRRQFLRLGSTFTASAVVGTGAWQQAIASLLHQGGPGPYGALEAPDANGIMLPTGFTSRVVAESDELVPGTGHTWHVFPDGGDTFVANGGGYIYVSNSEWNEGDSVGAVRFDNAGNVQDAYAICTGTARNCSGGRTPWGTWLSCEEIGAGQVWECDPQGVQSQVAHPAMGVFRHEAACYDMARVAVYMTEDTMDGRLYRYRPDTAGDLSSGVLEVAEVVFDPGGLSGDVLWHVVPDPLAISEPTRYQVPQATVFNGGEGMVTDQTYVYFTTKGDDRVWQYRLSRKTICVYYDANADPAQQLTAPDNVTISSFGDVIVAEDGGNMELVVLTPEGEAAPLLRVIGQDDSELTGPAFDPSGRRLYFSSQRGGPHGTGITYEVTGPFRKLLGC